MPPTLRSMEWISLLPLHPATHISIHINIPTTHIYTYCSCPAAMDELGIPEREAGNEKGQVGERRMKTKTKVSDQG